MDHPARAHEYVWSRKADRLRSRSMQVRSEVWISAGKMGGKESIWNNVDDATLGPMGDTIEGTLVAGLKRYRFSITQDGENIQRPR